MDRKTWPNEISVNMLTKLTGKDRGTVSRRLEGLKPLEAKTNSYKYDLKLALQYIYEPMNDPDSDQGPMNPQLERAKLDRARRMNLELDIEVRKKNLIERSELKSAIENVFGAVRAKLLNLPLKCAQSMPDKPDPKQVQSVVKKEVNNALTDLSEKKLDEFI